MDLLVIEESIQISFSTLDSILLNKLLKSEFQVLRLYNGQLYGLSNFYLRHEPQVACIDDIANVNFVFSFNDTKVRPFENSSYNSIGMFLHTEIRFRNLSVRV